MMFDWSALAAAVMLGLFSSAHCVGMCGGIMGALSMAIPAQAKARRWFILCSYNIGRVASYAVIGVLAGAMAAQLAALGAANWLRWLAGILLILMGLYLADWWRGLTYLETAGRYLWAYIQPLGKRLMPVDNVYKALALGFIWGWLPCGLVYSALVYAMAQGRAVDAGLVMFAFGVGTLPSVLATGFVAQQLGQWLRKPLVRWPLAAVIILFGVWTIWGGGHTGHDHHHNDHSAHHDDHNNDHSTHSTKPVEVDHSHHHSHEPGHSSSTPQSRAAITENDAGRSHHNHHQHSGPQSSFSASSVTEHHHHDH